MTSLDDLLRARRSIRLYQPQSLPEALIAEVLRPAAQAPSSGNSQPVRLVRMQSEESIAKLRNAMEAGRQRFCREAEQTAKPKKLQNWINAYYRYSRFMVDAPLLLAVGTTAGLPSLSRTLAAAGFQVPEQRWQTDADMAVGLALQAVMLKAQELGLGTCILTAPLVFIGHTEELLALTDLEIKCFLTIGYPAESPKGPPKKDLAQIFREI